MSLHLNRWANIFCIYFHSKHDINGDEVSIQSKAENTPASLVVQCLRSVVINMESMPRNELQYLPNPYQELFLPDSSFVQTKFNLWPRHVRGGSTTLMVKQDMIISEIQLLLRQKLQLGSDWEVHVFKRSLPLEDDEVFQEEKGGYDCVFTSSKLPTNISSLAARIGKSQEVLSTTSNKDVSITAFYSVNSAETNTPCIWNIFFIGVKY